MAIRIITDSTSDINVDEAREKGIGVGRVTIVMDGVEYIEGDNITYENFYDILENSTGTPVTSQPSPAQFLNLFNQAKEAGDQVIGLFVSSQLSGTYQSACIAAQSCEYRHIHLVDTGNISISVRLMVYTAMKFIDQGMDYETLCKTMDEYAQRLDAFAIIGDLKYLKRSGRLSPTTAFVANLFNMKPITTLKGKVEVVGKARGIQAAIDKTFDIITTASGGIDDEEMCIVGYTGPQTTWYKDFVVKGKERRIFGKNLKIFPIGASVGNHMGSGSVAFAFFRKK